MEVVIHIGTFEVTDILFRSFVFALGAIGYFFYLGRKDILRVFKKFL